MKAEKSRKIYGATTFKVIKTIARLKNRNLINFGGLLRALITIVIIRGTKNTIELILTPNAKPNAMEEIARFKVISRLINFIIKSSDKNRKKVWADSGVAKWACCIAPGVRAIKKAAR